MRLLAALVVVTHIAFVLFVVLGGLLVMKWPRVAWVHAPAAAWGAVLALNGTVYVAAFRKRSRPVPR